MARRIPIWLATLTLGAAGASLAQAAETVEMYKNPYCGCCGKWAEHISLAGFKVKVIEVEDVSGTRKKLGMPEKLGSCHTAKVGNYLLEGHVPADDIKKLIKGKPQALGLAVPGMPASSPGMNIPNSPSYDTLLVLKDGTTRVFARH